MASAAAGEALGNRPRAADVVDTVGAGATGAGLELFTFPAHDAGVLQQLTAGRNGGYRRTNESD